MQLKRDRRKTQPARQYRQKDRTRKQATFSYRSSRQQTDRLPRRGGEDSRGNNSSSTVTKLSLAAKLQYGLVLILVLFGVGYSLSLDTNAQIKVEGSESFPRDRTEYVQAIQQELNSSVWNRNKLTLNNVGIEDSIRDKFPEVRSIDIDTGFLRHKPVVNVALAVPTVRLVTQSESYILDREGRALFSVDQQASDLDINSLIPIVDNSGHPIEIGKPAITEQQISYIAELIGQMKQKDINIRDMSLAGGGAELHVHFSDKDYFVKFSFMADARQSSGAYLALVDQKVAVSQYVDLRVPGRAYVK